MATGSPARPVTRLQMSSRGLVGDTAVTMSPRCTERRHTDTRSHSTTAQSCRVPSMDGPSHLTGSTQYSKKTCAMQPYLTHLQLTLRNTLDPLSTVLVTRLC